ncbi:CoA ester lyase [Paraburkholderia edwinii]|uniref:CoA ester lyase n=2 Tax=Paraburkholderia edwinii TaxID=2861782 RepID=A0ABX8UY79_9BURK|nr:CoA ester lyase [Paraburkholderia edwinii]
MRSWLFTPATRPDRFANAKKSGVDVLIVDLEDAIQPDQKTAARNEVRRLLDAPDSGALPTLAVRINSPRTRWGLDDLLMLLDAARAPHFILLPKIESAAEVTQVGTLLDEARKACKLVPMIESARGLDAAVSIAQASVPSVHGSNVHGSSVHGSNVHGSSVHGSSVHIAALNFGAADYASDVGAQPASLALQWARCRVASACAQAGVPALDSPCFAIHDAAILQTELDFASTNGFVGKTAIHPSHVAPINAAFTPSAQRVEWAKRVIDACDAGAAVVDGRMVDEAIAREARRVLAAISA